MCTDWQTLSLNSDSYLYLYPEHLSQIYRNKNVANKLDYKKLLIFRYFKNRIIVFKFLKLDQL